MPSTAPYNVRLMVRMLPANHGSQRVLLDCRRRINSGIGRVSQWLSGTLGRADPDAYEVVCLASTQSSGDYDFTTRLICETAIAPFSTAEFHDLPRVVASGDFRLYVNPHVTWSPLHTIPTINIIHDLWTIEHPEWLPGETDLAARFRVSAVDFGEEIIKWFATRNTQDYLTPLGVQLWSAARERGNTVELGSWAQYAAMTAHSAAVVAVSGALRERLAAYFVKGDRALIIHNVPKRFDLPRRTGGAKHFLTLAKLEPRKNLHFLLDAYAAYSCRLGDAAIPLVIGGDRGYPKYSDALLQRLSAMRDVGHRVRYVEPTSDAELTQLLGDAVAVVNASLAEGFGLPALEALLAEVPLLSTPTGIMATDLGETARLINPEDASSLTEAMVEITKSPPSELARRQGASRVQQFITASGAERQWTRLVERLLNEKTN